MKKVRGKLIIIISIFLFFMIFISKSIGYDAIINSQEYQTRVNDVAELFDSEYERKRAEAQAIIEASQVHTSSNEKNKYVFITKDSSKYHNAGCDYIDGNPYRVTLEYAQNNGYGPCKYCNPYSQYKNYENAWWDNSVFIICIIVIIIVFIIIFFLSKRKKKQKNVLNNFDEYNIGNSNIEFSEVSIEYDENKKTKEEYTKSNYKNHINEKSSTVLKEQNNRIQSFTGDYNPKDISNANDLPMRWYKFYNYVRLPLGIAFGIYDLLLVLSWFSLSPTIGIIGIIICLFQIIYLSYLLNIMNKKLKNGFTYIVIWLIIETFFMGLNITLNAPVIDMPTFVFSIIVGILVWFWPNYVYFNKRKYVFTEDK